MALVGATVGGTLGTFRWSLVTNTMQHFGHTHHPPFSFTHRGTEQSCTKRYLVTILAEVGT